MSVLIIRKGSYEDFNVIYNSFYSFINRGEAGCGGCGPSKTHRAENKGLLESVPRNNYLRG